ncbi:CXXC motif containing zinc binding protein [Anthophora retusa]
MGKKALQIKARLENVEEIKPSGPDFRWYLKFVCGNCGEASDKWNYVSLSEAIPGERGNTVNHIVMKCKLCSRVNSMSILKDSIKPYIAVNDEDQEYQTIVIFDCRGMEPTDFSAREGWIVKAVNDGKEFTDVDLSEGEWVDYCDKINEPIGIYEIEHRFVTVK